MKRTVLFACPHNAAKSVLAAAYCQRLAQQHGLPIEVRSGGTEPDAQVAPAVATLLRGEGIDVSDQQPRSLVQADIDQADCVVSLGCWLDQFDLSKTLVERWDDVPPPSVNLQTARAVIIAHVAALVTSLQRESQA